MNIAGIQPFSTIDWPGKLAATIFTQGCPWRCHYCHNPSLQPIHKGQRAVDSVLAWLETRKGKLEAVVISGGEPCLHTDLSELCERIQNMGFKVGLHTSGAYPYRLQKPLQFIDWVGLDYKAPMYLYDKITHNTFPFMPIDTALKVLTESQVTFEVRTTWHPDFLSYADLCVMAEELLEWEIHEWVIQLAQNTPTWQFAPFGLDTSFVHEMFKIGMNVKVR